MFRKIRLISWVTKAFLSRHGKILIIGFVVGIIGFILVYKFFPNIPQPKKNERIAVVGKYGLDNLPEPVLNLLSVGLTTVSNDGSAAEGLADKWEISSDSLEYTFTLKDNLYWKDGLPLKADQIDINFAEVEKTIIDAKTIRFKLKEPFAPFLTILAKPVFKKNLIGVGPYQVKSIKKQGQYLEKISLSSDLENLTFHFYANDESAILGFKLGQVDRIANLLTDPLGEVWQKNTSVSSKIDPQQFTAIFFNTDNSFLADKSIRQALAYSIKDKPEGEARATGPISPKSWAYSSDVKLYQYDPQKAKELFKKDSQPIKEKLKISTTPAFLDMADMIKKSWEEILGLDVQIEIINTLPSDYQVFLGMEKTPLDPDQYLLWHSTRAENITHLKSPKIDKILEDSRKITDIEARKEKYADFQRFITEECPAVFLSHPELYQINRSKFFNWL